MASAITAIKCIIRCVVFFFFFLCSLQQGYPSHSICRISRFDFMVIRHRGNANCNQFLFEWHCGAKTNGSRTKKIRMCFVSVCCAVSFFGYTSSQPWKEKMVARLGAYGCARSREKILDNNRLTLKCNDLTIFAFPPAAAAIRFPFLFRPSCAQFLISSLFFLSSIPKPNRMKFLVHSVRYSSSYNR